MAFLSAAKSGISCTQKIEKYEVLQRKHKKVYFGKR